MNYRRTHNCNTLTSAHVDEEVLLCGWVHRRRDHGGLIFIDLRDRFGLTQLVFNPTIVPSVHTLASTLRSEWVISIEGTVVERAPGMHNANIKSGEIEIEVKTLEVLSKAAVTPFSIADERIDVS